MRLGGVRGSNGPLVTLGALGIGTVSPLILLSRGRPATTTSSLEDVTWALVPYASGGLLVPFDDVEAEPEFGGGVRTPRVFVFAVTRGGVAETTGVALAWGSTRKRNGFHSMRVEPKIRSAFCGPMRIASCRHRFFLRHRATGIPAASRATAAAHQSSMCFSLCCRDEDIRSIVARAAANPAEP